VVSKVPDLQATFMPKTDSRRIFVEGHEWHFHYSARHQCRYDRAEGDKKPQTQLKSDIWGNSCAVAGFEF
jgi:hypothetical protein